ncbi:hypothetical protein [Antarcticirhabdus aurantiaca]|uniref:Uncharacterized protein n=1 Tax=Antarcticirhabdus aurantiaca TaxID=2606717 RepID=A0ACD4NPZ8_9HYPH|nr:hypothetical protein [Antarcticirhabdus aurantiaca]WAJ28913.1 hypothetical protein OXU80_01265 [Jeongeuplla avenae]
MSVARLALTILLTALAGVTTSHASAASFDVVAQKDSGDWSAVLYRNQSSARLFCALESHSGGTVFRIVRYKDDNDTFLEVHNSSWSLMEGRSTFAIDFTIKGEAFNAELAGQRYSDAYVHDFTENQTYLTLLGAIASASSMKVTNPNGTALATLRGLGSKQALDDFGDCVSSS